MTPRSACADPGGGVHGSTVALYSIVRLSEAFTASECERVTMYPAGERGGSTFRARGF
jgi:hypothetical protein